MIGKRFGGTAGMLLASLLIALPGSFGTVLILSGISGANSEILKQIGLVSVGISAFIISMLIGYIGSTINWAKSRNKTLLALGIIIGVFVLNSGKSLHKILSLFGIKGEALFSVSTVDILIVTFFVLLFTQCDFTFLKVAVSALVSIPYILCKSNIDFALFDNSYFLLGLQLVMIVLSAYGVYDKQRNGKKRTIQNEPVRNLLYEELSWLIFFLVLSIPAIFVYSGLWDFLGKGFLSSIMSFGGGDAYLTIADSMFVSDTMVTEDNFYGQLVTVVNVLPGSILCKTLTGIGYFLGYNGTGSVLQGYAVALAGFGCSIVGSCSVVSLAQFFFKKFEKMRVFRTLKSWVKTIISGLLGSVILSLIYQSLKMGNSYGCPVWIVGIEFALILALNLVLNRFTKVSSGLRVVISCAIALVIGNIIM
jgi:chromate transporter